MDTRQLEIYITAAQYLNFTSASKQLHMAPSAVSHSISMLEKELKTKLFSRDNNRISLTEYGEEFLKDAIKITTIANNAIYRSHGKEIEENTTLRIGFVYPEFIYKYLSVFSSYHKMHPSVDIIYEQHDSIALSKMLTAKKLDVVFGRQDMFSMDSHVVWKKLYRDPFKLVMHRLHHLNSKEKIRLPDLQHERILVMNRSTNPGMFDMIQHLFLSHNMMPNLHDHSNHHMISLLHAVMKEGIVIIPNLNIHYVKLPEELIVRDVADTKAFHEIGLAWNTEETNAALRSFLKEFGILYKKDGLLI